MHHIATLREYDTKQALLDDCIPDLSDFAIVVPSIRFGHHFGPIDPGGERQGHAMLALVDLVLGGVEGDFHSIVVATKLGEGNLFL